MILPLFLYEVLAPVFFHKCLCESVVKVSLFDSHSPFIFKNLASKRNVASNTSVPTVFLYFSDSFESFQCIEEAHLFSVVPMGFSTALYQ